MIEPRAQGPRDDFELRPLLALLWSYRMPIGGAMLVAAVLAVGIGFLLPRWFRSTAVILPPEESDLLSNLSLAQRALTKFPAFGVLGETFTPADVFKAILRSRTVAEEIADQFGLQRVYRQRSREKTLKELSRHVDVRLNPDGTLAVSVEDRDPKQAAAMAMAYLDGLDRYNIQKRNSQARRTRQFLERRVWETDSLLRADEALLRRYQERSSVVVPPANNSGLQAAADLMARKIFLEVRLGVLRSYLREDNDEILQTRTELEELKRRLQGLPAVQTDLLRLIRDQKAQEQLYLMLTAELEQARIRETMDTPTIQVLDRARPAERHSRPRKSLLAAGAALIAFVGAAGWLLARPPATRT